MVTRSPLTTAWFAQAGFAHLSWVLSSLGLQTVLPNRFSTKEVIYFNFLLNLHVLMEWDNFEDDDDGDDNHPLMKWLLCARCWASFPL